jgi:alpha-D-xyloside xylohydrolase
VIAGAPFDSIPVYVRAGSIVPLGPELQYTSEKPADPIALYVFAGADGHFVLYEDQGTTYDYEKGALATIDLTWTDATKTLTLGARVGTFPDMLRERTFQVVMVRPGKAAGYGPTPADAVSVRYDGSAVSVPLK